MTDPHLDELASAHLDGATTPEEAARIEADPALQARVEELRAVRDAVAAAPPPVDPAQRDAAIAAAVAAVDVPDEPADPSVVTPLRAPARRAASPVLRRVLGAAAAVVLLALLVPLLGRLGQSNDDDSASFDSTGSALEGPTGAQDSAEDAGDTSSTTAALSDRDLGTFDDLDALVTALSAPDAQETLDRVPLERDGEATFDAAACAPTTAQSAEGAPVERVTATVGVEPVIVVVREGDDRARRVVVYRATDCQVLADAQL